MGIKMLKNIMIVSLLLLSLVISAQDKAVQNQSHYSLKITLEYNNGKEVVTGAQLLPGVKTTLNTQGKKLRLYNESGDLIYSGKIRLDRRIFHDKSMENGELLGDSGFYRGPLSIKIPWVGEAAAIEIGDDGNGRVALANLMRQPAASPPLKQDLEPANYGGYISSLVSPKSTVSRYNQINISPAATKKTNAKKIKVPLAVSIKKMMKSEQEQVLLNVRAVDNVTGKIAKKRTVNPFTQPNKANLKLKPGSYTIYANCKIGSNQLYPAEMIINDFQPSTKTLNLKWDKPNKVEASVKNRNGEGMQARISLLESRYTGSTRQYCRSTYLTDAQGEVELMLPPDALTFIVEPIDRLAASATVFVKKVKARKSKAQKLNIVLPENNQVEGDALKKLWDSGSDNSKLNFIFLSDAYTGINETFTDINGNGIWDGDLLLDENDNDEWDSGERYIDRNGNGVFDKPEPFEDTNGDKICNRYERAEFELTAAMMTAVVMNFEPFKSYSDSMNVYSYWTPSTHGAQKMPGFPSPWKDMQTYYETECDRNDYYGDRGKFNLYSTANYTTINQSVNQVLPNSRFYVLLVRDPFNIMVSNSAILQSAADTRGGMVLIHEMGHKVGGLADEYVYGGDSWKEYPNSYESSRPNLTNNTNRETTKWADLLKEYTKIPTPTGEDGYGLFEGGSWAKGIYRPTEFSMMRSTAFPFYKVNAEAIIKVLEHYK
jgi:hypothetical protein